MKKLLVIAALFGAVISVEAGVRAMPSDTLRVAQGDEVVVRATIRVENQAVTKTVIDSLQIAHSANSSLAELISKSTPAFIKTYGQGSIATISFRGTGASHTQVQWNGININNPMLGQVDFSQIPVGFIDNVELYHGGSSLHNSTGALGGAISIATKPQWDEPYHGSVMQTVGSFGKVQTIATIGAGNRKVQGKLRYMFDMAENDFSYFNTAIPPFEKTKQTNASYKKHAVAGDIYYNVGRNNFLTLNGWFHTSDRNLPTIMSYEGLGRREKDNTTDVRAALKWAKYWEDVSTQLVSGYTRTDMDYLLSNKTYFDWVQNASSSSSTNSFFNTYSVKWDISDRSVLKAKVNVDYHDVSTNNKLTQEGYANNRLEGGATVSFHHSFSKYLSGYLLVSEELSDGEFSPVMPSVGLSTNPLNRGNLNIAINGTRNYHKPTLNDLYWQPGGNPDLRHEQGYSTDFTVDYAEKWGDFNLKIHASAYMSWIDDWIIWQPSDFTYWTAQNIQNVFSRGVEANVDMKYSVSGVNLRLAANYAFTRTTNESDDVKELASYGKQLIYVPLQKFNILFAAEYRKFYLDFAWNYTSERFTSSSNEVTRHNLPEYTVCDLTVGKKFFWGEGDKRGLDVQFRVNNIFDVHYQSILWRAMPGVNFQVQVKFKF